jgi:hypothetical protein
MDYVYSHVWGPLRIASRGGHMYFVIFIDDFSKNVWANFIWHKPETFAQVQVVES